MSQFSHAPLPPPFLVFPRSDGHASTERTEATKIPPGPRMSHLPLLQRVLGSGGTLSLSKSCNFQGIYCIDAGWMRWNDIPCLTRGLISLFWGDCDTSSWQWDGFKNNLIGNKEVMSQLSDTHCIDCIICAPSHTCSCCTLLPALTVSE